MLHRPIMRALFAGAVFSSLMMIPGPALADTFYETVFLPTSSVVSLPTSSVVSTSYLVPTSYSSTIIPTSTIYTSDSVLIPTSTTYYRPSIFRPRRYVERTTYSLTPTSYVRTSSTLLPTSYIVPTAYYLPTSYIAPTTYFSSPYITPTSYVIDNGVVTTSASFPCETTSSAAPAPSTANRSTAENGPSIISKPSNERRPTATLNNSSVDDGIPSVVTPPVPASSTTPPPPKPAVTPGTGQLAEPDPIDPSKIPNLQPGTGANPNDKILLPAPGTSGPQQPNETTFRNVRKPIYDIRNILRGRVISAESKQAEEGITIILSSLNNKFVDRSVKTDADGEFKVSLPDGDWTVKVEMPSGSILRVSQDYVTASNGKVTSASGRPITDYLIQR